MDISKGQTLKEIQSSIESVEEARSKSGLTTEEKSTLEQVSLKLSNIEQMLIRKIEDDTISKLSSDSKALMALSMQIEKSANSLESVCKSIAKATSVIETLIKAVSLGNKLIS